MASSSDNRESLRRNAAEAMSRAYAPYSGYLVGAAVLTETGNVFVGCNVENASYGLCQCAERVAIGQMVSAGEQSIQAIAIATKDGGSPCGACRQVIAEFAEGNTEILLANAIGNAVGTFTLDELLPERFSLRDGN